MGMYNGICLISTMFNGERSTNSFQQSWMEWDDSDRMEWDDIDTTNKNRHEWDFVAVLNINDDDR